jgi:hypothetical protein
VYLKAKEEELWKLKYSFHHAKNIINLPKNNIPLKRRNQNPYKILLLLLLLL